MAQPSPSVLIVPGAWHQIEAYQSFISHLHDAGFAVSAVRLPSFDTKTPRETSCTVDTEAVRLQILNLIDKKAKDVLVVTHSYGGVPAGGAISGLSKVARLKEGKQGGVIGIVYITAFVAPEGTCVLDILGGEWPPFIIPDQPLAGLCVFANAKNVLYNDLSDDEAERLVHLLRPHSMCALETGAPPPAWADPEFAGKLTFVRCMRDQGLPPSLHDALMEDSDVEWDVKDIDTSHTPFASKPKELVAILSECVHKYGNREA